MKIIAIGDIHGRDSWKEIVKQDFDKVIFIGDYFDSHDIPFKDQLQNFQAIIAFKKENIDKVVLLIGNHDFHYLRYVDEHYSGYQEKFAYPIGDQLRDAIEAGYLQMCSLDDGFLFTHAGVTKTWAEFAKIDLNNIEGSINKCFRFTPQMFKFMDYDGADATGDNVWSSPIWVRPNSLGKDMVEGYVQVVGHTQHEDITLRATGEKRGVLFIDCPGKYVELDGPLSIHGKNI